MIKTVFVNLRGITPTIKVSCNITVLILKSKTSWGSLNTSEFKHRGALRRNIDTGMEIHFR